jgi:hypothetical protein
MENYIVVLFKNKIRKRIIKKFITYNKAINFFEKLKKENDEIIFNKLIENTKKCEYELSLIEYSSNRLIPIYLTDEMGRNIKVKIEDDNLTIVKIIPYKIEDTIYDLQKKEKITTQKFLKSYLTGDGLKMISVLNNKIILQKDDEIYIFSLKSESESSRFVDCLSLHFFKIKRGDCLFIKDYSSPQRKYLYSLLESKGFDKKILYRKFTTHPRSK